MHVYNNIASVLDTCSNFLDNEENDRKREIERERERGEGIQSCL